MFCPLYKVCRWSIAGPLIRPICAKSLSLDLTDPVMRHGEKPHKVKQSFSHSGCYRKLEETTSF